MSSICWIPLSGANRLSRKRKKKRKGKKKKKMFLMRSSWYLRAECTKINFRWNCTITLWLKVYDYTFVSVAVIVGSCSKYLLNWQLCVGGSIVYSVEPRDLKVNFFGVTPYTIWYHEHLQEAFSLQAISPAAHSQAPELSCHQKRQGNHVDSGNEAQIHRWVAGRNQRQDWKLNVRKRPS